MYRKAGSSGHLVLTQGHDRKALCLIGAEATLAGNQLEEIHTVSDVVYWDLVGALRL